MKYALHITQQGEADLDEIMDYIAMDAPLRAESFVDELLDKIRSLSAMPTRCPVAPETVGKQVEIRHLIHGSYRILFLIEGKTVLVLRVIHGARLFQSEGTA